MNYHPTLVSSFIIVDHAVARPSLGALRGGASATFNCGYGRGYSVRQVIEAVRRISGRPIAVTEGERRPGDIMTMVADVTRIHGAIKWTPRYGDLDTIATHALAWEEKLQRLRAGGDLLRATA